MKQCKPENVILISPNANNDQVWKDFIKNNLEKSKHFDRDE